MQFLIYNAEFAGRRADLEVVRIGHCNAASVSQDLLLFLRKSCDCGSRTIQNILQHFFFAALKIILLKSHCLCEQDEGIPVALSLSGRLDDGPGCSQSAISIAAVDVVLFHGKSRRQNDVRVKRGLRHKALVDYCKEIFPLQALDNSVLVGDCVCRIAAVHIQGTDGLVTGQRKGGSNLVDIQLPGRLFAEIRALDQILVYIIRIDGTAAAKAATRILPGTGHKREDHDQAGGHAAVYVA